MTHNELLAALEAATGPDRELDFWCWWYGKSTEASSPNPTPPDANYVARNIRMHEAPRYTSSIDAALTLVPEGFYWDVSLGHNVAPNCGPYWASVYQMDGEIGWEYPGEPAQIPGITPALALCIAVLKARTA